MAQPRMIDSREVKHKSAKLWLWIIWLIIMVVSVAYCVLSFIAFRKIYNVYEKDNNGVESGTLWSTLCATFIGPFTVVAFFVLGTLILLRKTISESGLSYSYGALHWSSLWMAVVVLQSAVSLQGEKDTMRDLWEKKPEGIAMDLPWSGGDTAMCQGAYTFAYILSFAYLILFIMLFVFRGAAKKLVMPPDPAATLTTPSHSETKLGKVSSDEPVQVAAPPAAVQEDAKKEKKGGFFSRHKKEPSASAPMSDADKKGSGKVESAAEVTPVVVRPAGEAAATEAQPVAAV